MNDNFEDKRGRGRPLKEDSFRNQLHIRLGEDVNNMLIQIMYETDQSKSDIIRSAIRMYYNLTMHRR